MARFCSSCGAQMADAAGFCPACGKPNGAAATTNAAAPAPATAGPVVTAPAASAGGLADNVAGMLAYFTIIPAILFIVMEPYNKKPFVRFHAFQSLIFQIAWILFWMVMTFIPFVGLFLVPILGIGGLILWIILVIKANSGQMFKLPIIGDIAEKQANAM